MGIRLFSTDLHWVFGLVGVWKFLHSLVGCLACSGDVGVFTGAAKATNSAAPHLRCVFTFPSTASSTSNLISSLWEESSPVALKQIQDLSFLEFPALYSGLPQYWTPACRVKLVATLPCVAVEGRVGGNVRTMPAESWGNAKGELKVHTEKDFRFSMSSYPECRVFSDQKVGDVPLKRFR